MRLGNFLLVTVVTLLSSTDAVSAVADLDQSKISPVTAVESPLELTARPENDNNKRFLRITKAKNDDGLTSGEERMFVGTLNSVLGGVGSVVKIEKVAKVTTGAARPLQKYQKWIDAGLSPSAVRVDIMKIEPWTLNRGWAIAKHPDFVQYAKFMVKHEMIQQAKAGLTAAT